MIRLHVLKDAQCFLLSRCHFHNTWKSTRREKITFPAGIKQWFQKFLVPYTHSQCPLPYPMKSILQNSGLQNPLRKIITIKQDIAFSREPGWRSRYSEWLRVGQPRGLSSSIDRVKNFLFSTSSRLALGPAQPPIQWVPGALSPGVKRPGCDADHSPPTSAEAKKTWIYTSTPPCAFMV
jgi:hypothetical protein